MGVIQGSINQLLATAGMAARLSPGLEEKAKTRAENKELTKQEARLEQAYEDFVNAPTPKGMSQQEAAEYEEKIGKQLLSELGNVQTELAKRGIGGFSKAIATKGGEASYGQEITGGDKKAIAKQAAEQKAAQDMAIKQEERRKSEQFRQMFTEGGRYK